MTEYGRIFDIQRFSTHDGPGIRTTVFLKGCPLDCRWCHNPEGKSYSREIGVFVERCIECGHCIEVCPNHAFTMKLGKPEINRADCKGCGKCVQGCNSLALKLYGTSMTAEEVLREINKDKLFYVGSGGGVTVSGGEPLAQPEFTSELFKICRQNGINTAVETSGFALWECFESLIDNCNLFLYDLKCFDEELHRYGTGQSNEIILSNLNKLILRKSNIIIRIPVIPGFNDTYEQMKRLAQYANSLENIKGVQLMPFHRLAATKYRSIDTPYEFGGVLPDSGKISEFKALFERSVDE